MSERGNARIYVAIAAALVVAFVLVAAASSPARIAQATVIEPIDTTDGSITSNAMTAEEYAEATKKSAIKSEFVTKEVQIQRGTSQSIDVLIKHIGGEEAEQTATVTISAPYGYILLPKSVAESTTFEERVEAARTGKVLTGGIDLGTFVKVDESAASEGQSSMTVMLAKNTERMISVQISIPEDLSAELVGTGFHIPVVLEASGTDGKAIVVENNGVDVVIG